MRLPHLAEGLALRSGKLVLAGVLMLLGVAFWFAWQLWALRSPVASAPVHAREKITGVSHSDRIEEKNAPENTKPPTSPPVAQEPERMFQEDDGSGTLVMNQPRLEVRLDTAPAVPEVALQQATAALTRNDLPDATRHFSALLEREPHHLGARLGLAEVAFKEGNFSEARSHYQAALASFPQDARAEAGMLALMAETSEVAPDVLESRLRHILLEQPKIAAPYFVLGNLLAGQGRWQEAEAAYFAAYQLDANNPDYCFNLAVSLDALRQGKLAAGYYRAALHAAEALPTAFDPAIARQRLNFLEAVAKGEAP